MFESRITIKGQTTLPKPVRDSLEVKPGDKVRYVIIDEMVAQYFEPEDERHGVRHRGPAQKASEARARGPGSRMGRLV